MLARALEKLGFVPAARLNELEQKMTTAARNAIIPRISGRRQIKAALTDRLNASFQPVTLNADGVLRGSIRLIRGRSRALYYNNDYTKDFYRKLKTNVIGHTGIRLQAKCKNFDNTLDTNANGKIERAWTKWGKRGNCDVTRRLSWLRILNLTVETLARDGELLIRKVRGFKNEFGFALQLLEADHLDETLNVVLQNGNQIRMGVEYDEWDSPVAYWLLKKHPGDYLQGGAAPMQRHERILAADIIHIFDPWFIRQGRGMAWPHAVMSRMDKIDAFEEAAIIAARVGASKMGMYVPKGGEGQFEGDETTGGEEEEADFIEEAEPGVFGVVPDGYEFQEYNPQYPHGEYDPFMDRQLKGAASGFGVNYCTFANDAAEVNFSSLRHFAVEDRDYFKSLQQLIVEELCEEVYSEWLPMAMLAGQVSLPFAKIDKFMDHEFKPRRWDWVDPLKDVMARGKAVEFGFTNRKRVVEENADDWDELCQDTKVEQAIEEKNQVTLGKSKGGPTIASQA